MIEVTVLVRCDAEHCRRQHKAEEIANYGAFDWRFQDLLPDGWLFRQEGDPQALCPKHIHATD